MGSALPPPATILLVEDDPMVRDVFACLLAGYGYRVLAATHPAEALELADRHDGPIHLLVTDVVMPGMSGPQLAEQLAAGRPKTRVLFVSGHADEMLRRHGVVRDAIPLLHKPFGFAALQEAVGQALAAAA
jgi:two-component system cell cycle sensor histidine kinase/response regulator CckA